MAKARSPASDDRTSADPRGRRAATPSILVDEVDKTFRRDGLETRALAGASFQVARQEFLSIVGPSGCGKSTLLRLIAGLMAPDEGRIAVDGRPVSGPVSDVGIVFQKPVLLDWRTVLGNVLMQVELRGRRARDHLPRARQLLEAVSLTEFEDRYPYELSGGMQQRASIARALIHDPPLLLMDEPFGALDSLTRERMNLELQRIWIDGAKTVVLVTHSIEEAVFLSDRIIVMTPRPGRIAEILANELPRPRTVETYEDPRFTEYAGTIRKIILEADSRAS
jgi:NitT/TauT family transport system ATP-binding protein